MGKHLARLLVAIIVAVFVRGALAQTYPDKPVRVVVPYGAGGPTDIYARILSTNLSGILGKTFFVDDRPGAATIIGTQVVAKAPNDGYTLLFGVATTFVSNPYLYKSLPYKLEDFSPIAMVAESSGWALTIHPSMPVTTVAQLISFAKARPGQITVGTYGRGSGPYVVLKSFERLAHLKMIGVSYKGSAEVLRNLLAGQIMLSGTGIAGAIPLYKAGKVRILAFSGSRRVPQVPEIPTLKESGFPGLTLVQRFMLLAPKGVDERIVSRLNKAVAVAIHKDNYLEHLKSDAALVPENTTPAAVTDALKHDNERWKDLITALNIVPQ